MGSYHFETPVQQSCAHTCQSGRTLVLPDDLQIAHFSDGLPHTISLSGHVLKRVAASRRYLEERLSDGGTYYGVNTGFGPLCNVSIADEDLGILQENLVCSHACGMGDEVPEQIVRLMFLLKIHGLSKGYSGVRVELLQHMVALYNAGVLPVVYDQGSLGASGDLVPLAHLSLPLLGKGMVNFRGEHRRADEVLMELNILPLRLRAKEGLALLNGTQFMNAYAVWTLLCARRLADWAAAISALSVEVFDGKAEPFRPEIHRVRPHAGQIQAAYLLRQWLAGSELQMQPKKHVQDNYSFRCIPQVHGATLDVLRMAGEVVETEMSSVTDNPIVFVEEDVILSGGNFHGQPLALQLDFVAIALAELANISERRTYLVISGQRGLPPFLTSDPGLNSGFMIVQYAAAAIVSANKGLCMPASVDSITSSNGQEDHVSMGANAATKLLRVVKNVQRVLAIELLTAAQALEFRRPLRTSQGLEDLHRMVRALVPAMHVDRILHDDMVAVERLLDTAAPTWEQKEAL